MEIRKILVIEDDFLLRQTMRLVLEEIGYEVQEAENGLTGIDMSRSFQPQLIFCDVRLKGYIDGYATTRAIKSDPYTSHISIVLMTGYATEENRKEAEIAGAQYFLSKPFKVDELKELMEQLEEAFASAY